MLMPTEVQRHPTGARSVVASATRSAGARMTRPVLRHVGPSSCTGSKLDGRVARTVNATVCLKAREGSGRKLSRSRSTRQPSTVATVTIIIVGAAVTDTSPSRGGNDRRRWRSLERTSARQRQYYDHQCRSSRARVGADAKRRRTPTLVSEAVAVVAAKPSPGPTLAMAEVQQHPPLVGTAGRALHGGNDRGPWRTV